MYSTNPSLVGTRLSTCCPRQCAKGYRNGTLRVKAAPLPRKPPGGGYGRPQLDMKGAGNRRQKERGHDKSSTGAREPAGHRLRPSYFLFPAPEGGEKTKLGGELRREEQLISRTGICMDRVGTVDDLSEGGFRLSSPPSSGTTGVAHEQRSSMSDSTITSWPA
jgi:hypothetical protein